MSAALITPNVCHLGAAALAHVPVGHAMGDDGKAYDLVGFFTQHLAHAVARHVHAGHDSKDQLAVFAAACIEMMRPLVPDLAQRAHELCFPDDGYETHTAVGEDQDTAYRQHCTVQEDQCVYAFGRVFGPIAADIGSSVRVEVFAFKTRGGASLYAISLGPCFSSPIHILEGVSQEVFRAASSPQNFTIGCKAAVERMRVQVERQSVSATPVAEEITEDGEPQVLGHTLCFSYRGHSYSLADQPDYFGVGDVIHVLPAGTGDAVWVAIEDTATFGTYACCVQPIQMKEGTSHV